MGWLGRWRVLVGEVGWDGWLVGWRGLVGEVVWVGWLTWVGW